jgi:hypothetical protein
VEHLVLKGRVLFSGCKIERENLWLVYLHPTTNQRFFLRILQPKKRTLLEGVQLSTSLVSFVGVPMMST